LTAARAGLLKADIWNFSIIRASRKRLLSLSPTINQMSPPTRHSRISKRQQALLLQVRTKGMGQVDSLARQYNVTPQTIRRDLGVLCSLQLLLRVHGGAVAPGSAKSVPGLQVNLDYNTRRMIGYEAKETIGKLAAQLIPNDASLFINIGTTTECVARCLTDHIGLFAVTNNINIANTLRRSELIKVMTAGGLVRHEDGGIVGDATEEFVNQFKVDFAVIGCSALEEDGTMVDYDIREVRVTQAIIENARCVVLVADNSKFARKAPVRLGNVGQLDYFVTDHRPPDRFMEICRQHNTRVVFEAEE
jgi:DeoR family glycerol-3-phosphate regulon repressor